MTLEKAQLIGNAITASTDAILKPCGIRVLKLTLAYLSSEELTSWAASATGRLKALIDKEQEKRALFAQWSNYLQED